MMMRLCLTIAFLLSLATSTAYGATSGSLAIIVSADANRPSLKRHIDKRLIARIYRKQITLDRTGKRLHPINLPASHPLRRALSKILFHHLPVEMANYWNEKYFQGISPPHVVDSQEAMIRFIARTSGAIGYIADCMVDKRVRVLMKIKLPGNQIPAMCR